MAEECSKTGFYSFYWKSEKLNCKSSEQNRSQGPRHFWRDLIKIKGCDHGENAYTQSVIINAAEMIEVEPPFF